MPTKRKWQKPITCHTCNTEIQNGEHYEKTGNPHRAYCQKCSNKPVLVYQPKIWRKQ